MLKVTSQFAARTSTGQWAQTVMGPRVSAAVQQASELVQKIAKEHCPIDTGALNDSIQIGEQSSGTTITQGVAPGMFYASYVEYGTGKRGDPTAPYPHVESWPGMHAEPYMRPALDEARGQVKDVFQRELGGPWG